EAYVEPRTAGTQTTLVLVAHDGEWTRRRVDSQQAAQNFGKKRDMTDYGVARTGYPQRNRDYTERAKGRHSPGGRSPAAPDRGTGTALTRVAPHGAGVERGPRDVDVSPREVLRDEFAQEHARHEHAPGTLPRDVADIGELRVQFAAQLVRQRHGPTALTGLDSMIGDSVAEFRGAHDPRCAVPQCHGLRAGQRGCLAQVVGSVLGGTSDRIGQHESALRARVEDLDSLAAVHPQYVTGPVGRAGR